MNFTPTGRGGSTLKQFFMFVVIALATATASAQVAPTASESIHMHWVAGQDCVNFYNAHPNTPAYVPATPYHTKDLKAGEAILPLPKDAEGCYKQPLPGGAHEWVIRLVNDPTLYNGAMPLADGRCFNVFEGRMLFHTTPAPAPAPTPAPTTTNQQTTSDRELEYKYNLAVLLAQQENCSSPGPLLEQVQREHRKKNTHMSIQYNMDGCVIDFSNDNYKPAKPAGSGFLHSLGEYFINPPMYYPVGYGYGGGGYNSNFGGGHHGGGGHNTGSGGGNTTYGPGLNTGGAK